MFLPQQPDDLLLGPLAFDAQGNLVGQGRHGLDGMRCEATASEHRHDADQAIFHGQRIAGESDQSFPPGPFLVRHARIGDEIVRQVGLPFLGDQADLERADGYAAVGPVDMRVEPGAGLEHEHLSLRVQGPDAGERTVQVLDHAPGTAFQGVGQGIALGHGRSDFRTHCQQPHAFGELGLGLPAGGDVAEDQNRAGHLPILAANRRGTIVDGSLFAVAGNQGRVVGQPHDDAFLERSQGGVLDGLAGLLVDDLEDRFQGLAKCRVVGPASQLLCNRVEERDSAHRIGGDDCITDAGQRGAEPFALPVKNRRGPLAGQETAMEQPDDGGNQAQADECGDDAGGHGRLVGATRPQASVHQQVLFFLSHRGDPFPDGVHLLFRHAAHYGVLSRFLVLAAQLDGLFQTVQPGRDHRGQLGDSILLQAIVAGLRFQGRQQPVEPFEGRVVGLEVFVPAGQQETALSSLGVNDRQQDLVGQVEHRVGMSNPTGVVVKLPRVVESQRGDRDQQGRKQNPADQQRSIQASRHTCTHLFRPHAVCA